MGPPPPADASPGLAQGERDIQRALSSREVEHLVPRDSSTPPKPDPDCLTHRSGTEQLPIEGRGNIAEGCRCTRADGNHTHVPGVELVVKLAWIEQLAGQ